MSYDETLAGRVRRIIGRRRGVAERKMFSGLAFLLDGAMCCGVVRRDLVVRVGPRRYLEALAKPHTRLMDFTGRPLTGFVYVAPAGHARESALRRWIKWGIDFVSTLPVKRGRRQRPATSGRRR